MEKMTNAFYKGDSYSVDQLYNTNWNIEYVDSILSYSEYMKQSGCISSIAQGVLQDDCIERDVDDDDDTLSTHSSMPDLKDDDSDEDQDPDDQDPDDQDSDEDTDEDPDKMEIDEIDEQPTVKDDAPTIREDDYERDQQIQMLQFILILINYIQMLVILTILAIIYIQMKTICREN
jgi:hypothetical protein